MSNKETIYVIAGPTAGGKSAHALKLAEEKNGVIINADSMQVYDGLHLLTAQPSEEDLKQVPHKLYNALHPNDACSAGNWREMAEPVIHQTLLEGKTPIIVGGSGLYIKALIDGLSPIPDIPQNVRDQVSALQQELGNPQFYDALHERDPIMAERLHPFHTARLVRAYEVIEATGKSLADWQNEPLIGPPETWSFNISLILPERETLYQRCNDRFEWMMENGAVEETESFDQKVQDGEIAQNVPLLKALGFSALQEHIHGSLSKDEAITKAQGQTRQYAKRQVTWFKHQIKKQKNVAHISILD
ncbi:MAG: tRNA (adenosine(37)-N6)-dimethylallyltransferase MiaA [Pseudomonadota bacterium]